MGYWLDIKSRSNRSVAPGKRSVGLWRHGDVFNLRLAVFGAPTGIALTLVIYGPIAFCGLFPPLSRPSRLIFFVISRLPCATHNATKRAYKNQANTDLFRAGFICKHVCIAQKTLLREQYTLFYMIYQTMKRRRRRAGRKGRECRSQEKRTAFLVNARKKSES